MKQRFMAFGCEILLLFGIVLGGMLTEKPYSYSVQMRCAAQEDSAQMLLDGILQSQCNGDIQGWIDGTLTATAGVSAEWYILALSQYGSYDFTAYEVALQNYLQTTTVSSASSRQKYALVLLAIGSTDDYISTTLADSIGQQGIMSWVYGLHLLNNGCTTTAVTLDDVTQKLLSLQLADGGWAVTGTNADVDVTAMVLQALAPQYGTSSSVTAAIDTALALLSERQLADGDFMSYGVSNTESTAQVLTALSALGIDPMTDARFCKNGTILDGLLKYRLENGAFCHVEGGEENATATVQAFYALVAYWRMQNGRGSLYLLDNTFSAESDTKASTTTATTTEHSKASTTQTQQTTEIIKGTTIFATEQTTSLVRGTTEAAQVVTETNPTVQTNGATQIDVQQTGNTTSTTAVTTTIQTETWSDISTETVQNETNFFAESETVKIIQTTTVITTDTGETVVLSVEEHDIETSTHQGKRIASSIILLAAASVCLGLVLCKRRHPINFLLVLIGTTGVLLFVWLTDFQRTADYYDTELQDVAANDGTVTFAILCDTVGSANDYIPEDGVILEETEFAITAGDTVYDVLLEAAQTYGIQVDHTGGEGQAYIRGIQYLYEFDYGDLSGWMYVVNDEIPSVGCESYVLSDGDVVAWRYTCNMGKDFE